MLSIATDIMPLKCILTFKHTADIRKLTNLSVARRTQFKEFSKTELEMKKQRQHSKLQIAVNLGNNRLLACI